jgi:hypothetical protein
VRGPGNTADVPILATDIPAGKSIIHVIGGMILPAGE